MMMANRTGTAVDNDCENIFKASIILLEIYQKINSGSRQYR